MISISASSVAFLWTSGRDATHCKILWTRPYSVAHLVANLQLDAQSKATMRMTRNVDKVCHYLLEVGPPKRTSLPAKRKVNTYCRVAQRVRRLTDKMGNMIRLGKWNDERFSFVTTSLGKKKLMFWLDALVLLRASQGGLKRLVETLSSHQEKLWEKETLTQEKLRNL